MVVGRFPRIPKQVGDLCRSMDRPYLETVKIRAGQLSAQAKEEKHSLGDRSDFEPEELVYGLKLIAEQPIGFFFDIKKGHLPNLAAHIKKHSSSSSSSNAQEATSAGTAEDPVQL